MQDAIASFTRELTGMKDSQKFLQQSLSSVLPGEFEIFEFDGICCASPILRDFLDLLEIMLGWYWYGNSSDDGYIGDSF